MNLDDIPDDMECVEIAVVNVTSLTFEIRDGGYRGTVIRGEWTWYTNAISGEIG